ncbi:hypothetical protein [Halomonas ramblicola]|uniref:hypothetical protein n=1 Tax=Halomonas ramblicola TaxID=747349 RepID=UPI0025B2B1BA|nr:hypothetical protein [Halomonas ramblicola]MDN3523090.1 hypothetical protein [Halomonas ramblicola]
MGARGKSRAGVFAGLMMVAHAAVAELPHCEPRSQREPGRLNLWAGAAQYGLVPPCRATLEAYIPRMTALREFIGSLAAHDARGTAVASQALRVGLAPTDYGMFADEIALEPIEGHACQALALSMTISGCLGEGGEAIECPEVRVKAPDGFEAFSAGGAGVAVCRD